MGAVATQAYANPRYGPDGLALLRQGLSADEVVKRLTEADEGRDAAAARRRRRRRPRRHVHRLRLPRVGGRPHRPRLRRPGEHPRLRRDRRRPRRDLRGDGRLAGRATAGEPRGRPGRGRRQSRPAIRGAARRRAGRGLRRALRHPRRPARRRPRDPDRGAPAPLRRCTTSFSARPRATSGCPSTTSCGAEIRSAATRQDGGYERLEDWAGAANLEERVDGADEIDPVVLDELRRSE